MNLDIDSDFWKMFVLYAAISLDQPTRVTGNRWLVLRRVDPSDDSD